MNKREYSEAIERLKQELGIHGKDWMFDTGPHARKRMLGLANFHAAGAGAAQDPELAKYQRAMPNKPLTKPPGHYLTGYEGSECEQISDVELLLSRDTFRWQTSGDIGVDLKEFKKQCEEIGE